MSWYVGSLAVPLMFASVHSRTGIHSALNTFVGGSEEEAGEHPVTKVHPDVNLALQCFTAFLQNLVSAVPPQSSVAGAGTASSSSGGEGESESDVFPVGVAMCEAALSWRAGGEKSFAAVRVCVRNGLRLRTREMASLVRVVVRPHFSVALASRLVWFVFVCVYCWLSWSEPPALRPRCALRTELMAQTTFPMSVPSAYGAAV